MAAERTKAKKPMPPVTIVIIKEPLSSRPSDRAAIAPMNAASVLAANRPKAL